MQQFQDFYAFCQAVDRWGMQYGIVKVVPPKEWRDSLPDLHPTRDKSSTASSSTHESGVEQDDRADVSKIRIRNAIMQHFTPAGSGVWRQLNTTRSGKIWNAKQWSEMCVSEGQKGPEMDRMKWKVEVEGASNGGWGPRNIGTKDSNSSAILEEDGVRTRSGKARPSTNGAAAEAKTNGKRKRTELDDAQDAVSASQPALEEDPSTAPPPAPTSPSSPERRSQRIVQNTPVKSPPASRDPSPVKQKKNWEADATTHDEWCAFDYKNCWRKEALSIEQISQLDEQASASTSKSTDAAAAAVTAEDKALTAAPVLPSPSEWTPEVCREIESEYWRSLNFGKPPMYGADLSGTLFDGRTQHWNVGKLDSVLTRLRLKRKLPGVNTPYLYWGMWRATFAWHVEDMDLYSINYIHFGAPKQWYAIRQADRQRFESAMAGAFPSDARRCPHFMRHKSYLASPSFLASHGIRPLKLVHNAGEFVITYPFGYHSGFNLGYNCAESVNFALESWLDIGRKANYCHCDMSQNSVRIDVDALLEESKEMEELERKRELRRAKEDAVHAIEEEEIEKRRIRNEKAKERRRLKKEADEAAAAANPAIPHLFQGGDGFYVDAKEVSASPCVFCPANVHTDLVATPAEVDSTNSKLKAMSGRHAHRLCASFVPETWVGRQGKAEVVCGIEGIDKARFSLKCQICPSPTLQKLYPKIQCTRGKCPRSAHVSCALVEEHGWFVDVCPGETADRLEGKKTPTGAQQTDGLEDGERLVVLCKTHNPLFREAEEARKAEELRERVYALPIPSMVRIRTSGGMFQALMVEIREDEDEIVIEDEGRPSTVKFQQIIFESPGADEVKEEPQAVALPAAVGSAAAATTEDGSSQPNKRRRKASEKASANAKAAIEEAEEASLAAAEAAAAPAPAPKRIRKSRAEAAAAPAAAEVEATVPVLAAVPEKPEPKPKRQRQTKKKAAQEAVVEPVAAPMDLPPATLSWPAHAMHQPAPAQVQTAHPQQSKRGPRATYAAQAPNTQQPPQYVEQHPQYQHQQYAQQQQYSGPPEYQPMHRGQAFAMNGEAGHYAARLAGQPSGYARNEYPVGGASPSYTHQQPQQQQRGGHAAQAYGAPSSFAPFQQGGYLAHPQHAIASGDGGRHATVASSMSSAASPGMTSASQYGYLSAPPPGYQNRTPPLPTYAKPMAHQPHAASGGGYPDYRPPYNHAAPAGLHPAYQQQQQQQQQYGGYAYHYAPQQTQQPAQHEQYRQHPAMNGNGSYGLHAQQQYHHQHQHQGQPQQ
uniref:[Histone H3]-trimethyl-L-lysine(9) demethylase n=2 Tax=Kalmanozyma brasiliensis (strain GHG001) TaxID=1365824 RepID=V5EXL3_KALBG